MADTQVERPLSPTPSFASLATPSSFSSVPSTTTFSDETDTEVDPSESAVELSVKERERLTTVAKRMTESLLEATDLLGGIPWNLVHEKHGISLFRADAAAAGANVPCNVHSVCKFACDIEDVAASLITRTTSSFKQMMTMLSSDFLDGAVVQNIVEPTELNPFRYVALKWAAFKSSGPFAKDRDMLMLEYVDMIEDAQGQKIAFRIMESVGTPVEFPRFAESPKFSRDLVPLMGFMYHSTKKAGELRMTYTCNFDKNGDLPAWAANSAIQSHVEKCINGILKYTESFRVTREAIVLPQQVIPMSERSHCRMCAKKFCVRRRRYNCFKCGEAFCSSCSRVRTAQVPEIGERQLRVCTACVIEARRARMVVSASTAESSATPSFSSMGSQQSFTDASTTNVLEKEPSLGRVHSFLTANTDEILHTQKRRSYDDLLDPVRCRLIEYKTFSWERGKTQAIGAERAAASMPKASFPSRSFSDGLIMRNKAALFGAKRRGSPADLAISIEAFRMHQLRMGNAEQQPEDGDVSDDVTDDESSSTTTSPLYSITRPLPVEEPLLSSLKATKPIVSNGRDGRSRVKVDCECNQEESPADEDEDAFQFDEAVERAQHIITAANYANSMAQHARKLSHHRIVALQLENEYMAPMLRSESSSSSSCSPINRRRRRRGANSYETLSSPGAVLYSNQECSGR